MKNLLLLLCALPAFFNAKAQQDVLMVNRFLPKFDKIQAFEKALANHNKKFHTAAPYKATVFSVLTGDDAGSYQVGMGPLSWEEIDNRNAGEAHDADWDNNVMPLVQKTSSSVTLIYKADMSTIKMGEFAEKASVTHIYFKPGCGPKTEALLKGLKQYWEKEGLSIAVYVTNSSGRPAYHLVTRFKQGWKEKATGFHKSLKELMGEAAFNQFQESVSVLTESVNGESIMLRKDLSSN